LRAYIANIDSGLRIYPDDRAGVRCFSGPLGHPEGERYHSVGRFAKIRTATVHYGLYLREVEYSQEPYSGVPAAQDTRLQFYGASSAVRAIRIKSALAVGDNFTA
jgi:hypothetical protein